jgi:hypothetical protein
MGNVINWQWSSLVLPGAQIYQFPVLFETVKYKVEEAEMCGALNGIRLQSDF